MKLRPILKCFLLLAMAGFPQESDAADVLAGFNRQNTGPPGDDCDQNGVPDHCQLECNGNGIVDACDIASGFSADCDANGIPDECDLDCNENGVPDECDLAVGTSVDADGTRIPDECEMGSLCQTGPGLFDYGPHRTNATAEQFAIEISGAIRAPNEEYYRISRDLKLIETGGFLGSELEAPGRYVFDYFYVQGVPIPVTPGLLALNAYWQATGEQPVLSNWSKLQLCGRLDVRPVMAQYAALPGYVVGIDAVGCIGGSCNNFWVNRVGTYYLYSLFVAPGFFGHQPGYFLTITMAENGRAFRTYNSYSISGDCNDNGVQDECDIANCPGDPACGDCNANGLPDACDLEQCLGDPTCADVDGNGVPDGCDPDCNANHVPDASDIANCQGFPYCSDCNGNAIPDGCEVGNDCDDNDIPDECELAACTGYPTCSDCNGNLIPDHCDISACADDPACGDRNANQVPDGCETGACCNLHPFGTCIENQFSGQCACPQCTWTPFASCADVECLHEAIPAVSSWGLVVLTLLLLTGAKVKFRRSSLTRMM